MCKPAKKKDHRDRDRETERKRERVTGKEWVAVTAQRNVTKVFTLMTKWSSYILV